MFCSGRFQTAAVLQLLVSLPSEYSIRRVQVNQDGLKVNGTYQLLVHDDYNTLGGSVHTSKNTEALVDASKEIGLEVNADKTEYMVMSRDQDAGRSQNIKIDNVSLKGWKRSDIWEQPNKSNFYSGRN